MSMVQCLTLVKIWIAHLSFICVFRFEFTSNESKVILATQSYLMFSSGSDPSWTKSKHPFQKSRFQLCNIFHSQTKCDECLSLLSTKMFEIYGFAHSFAITLSMLFSRCCHRCHHRVQCIDTIFFLAVDGVCISFHIIQVGIAS